MFDTLQKAIFRDGALVLKDVAGLASIVVMTLGVLNLPLIL